MILTKNFDYQTELNDFIKNNNIKVVEFDTFEELEYSEFPPIDGKISSRLKRKFKLSYEEIKNVIGPFDGKYEFLSNFYVIDIEYNGIIFKSTEHAYQAMKASNFEDMMLVANAETPGKCKRIGRKIKIRPDWETAKFRIMKEVCRVKFSKPEMKKLLKETGTDEIVELNTWNDQIWGVCNGVGENNLGRILMELRNEI